MVVGGQKADDWFGHASDAVEVVSLDPENHPLTECMQNIKRFPYELYTAIGHVVPTPDGGLRLPWAFGGLHNESFFYDFHANTWNESFLLPEKGMQASASVYR